MDTIFFFGLLTAVTAAFIALVSAFAAPIFWAALLAVLFHPVQAWMERRLPRHPGVAAGITLLIVLVTAILPALWLGSVVAAEAAALYQAVQSGSLDVTAPIRWAQERLPELTAHLRAAGIDLADLRAQLSGATVSVSRLVATRLLGLGQDALRLLVSLALMGYLLFFFLRDGRILLEHFVRVMPLGDERERFLLGKFAEVSRAVLKGNVVVGIVQGLLGGAIFAVLGLQGAVFWGVVMALLSILPAVGAALIWAPAAIILLAQGALVKGLVLLAFGALVISVVDNLLRPFLVGRDTRMPDYLILLSTLGGLTLFGPTGFVAGPVLAALFLATWAMFEREFGDADRTAAPPPERPGGARPQDAG